MNFEYESPTFQIDWFEADGALATFDFSNTFDFIPDNESDDEF